EDTLRAALRAAVDIDDAPSVLRYPKGSLEGAIPAVDEVDGVDVLARHAEGGGPSVLVVGVGAMARTAVAVGQGLADAGVRSTVVDPRWLLPLPAALVKLAGEHDLVVSLEDGLAECGVGALLAQRVLSERVGTRVLPLGVGRGFIDHASRDAIIASE